MKKLKLNKEIKIDQEAAENIMKHAPVGHFHNFQSLLETPVENQHFFLKKIKRKGSSIKSPMDWEGQIAKEGIFELRVVWDYFHPHYFNLSKTGNITTFKVVI